MTNPATPRPTCMAPDTEHFAYWCAEAARVRGSDPAAELEALSHAVDSGDPCRVDCDFLAIYMRLSHLVKKFPHLVHQHSTVEVDALEAAVSQAVADPRVPTETLRSLWRKLRQTGKPSDSLECHVAAAMGDNAALNQLMTELPTFLESETHSAHQHFMRVADYLDAYVDQPPQVSEVAKLLRFVGRRQATPPYYGFALIIELLAVLAAQLPWHVMHGCIAVVQLLKLTKPQPWYILLPQLTISGRVFAEVSTRTTVDVIQRAAEIATYYASLFDARLSPTATGFRDAVSHQLDQQPPQPPSVDTVFPAPDSVPVTTTDDYFYQLKLSIYDIEREVTQHPTTERHLRLIELYDDLGWQSVAGCAVLELARTTTNPIEQFSLMERAYGYFDNAERLQPVDLSAELVRLGREIAATGECRYLARALLTHASALTYYTDTEMPAIMAVIDEAATVATTIDDGSFPPERFLQLKASVALACDDPESAFQFYEHAIAELVAKDQWDDAVELALRVATLCEIDERKIIALLTHFRDNPDLPDMRLYGRLAGATHDIIAGYGDT